MRPRGRAGLRPVDFIGNARRSVQQPRRGAQLYRRPGMIEVEGIRAGYGAINILWDVSVAIRPGELTTIIGPNGAGKTTLLRAIMGLVPLTQGAVRLDRSEEHTSELQSLMRISYAVFCLKKKNTTRLIKQLQY